MRDIQMEMKFGRTGVENINVLILGLWTGDRKSVV